MGVQPDLSNARYDELTFITSGAMDEDTARAAAESEMSRLAARAPEPVLLARVKITTEAHRPEPERVIAQGTMDVSGRIIRAEAAGPSAVDAMTAMFDRLDHRLQRLVERREDSRSRPPATPPGTWRHGDLPDKRPHYFDRPPGQAEIVRRKNYTADGTTIEEALFDLEVLDHRFFLFTDVSDGRVECIVYEGDGGVTLRRVCGGSPSGELPFPIEINTGAAPTLSPDEAAAQLEVSDGPFVFFKDGDTGHAAVLYRRYDGHYGLVTPA
jgi:ribosome-associated translation inhibitor RaiA